MSRGGRTTGENLPPAGRIARAGGLERAQDFELAYVRIKLETGKPARFDGAAQEMLIQIASGRQLRREERDANGVQTRLHLEMDVRCSGMHGLAASEILVPIVDVYALAIDQELELFARDLAKRHVVVHEALVDGKDLENVVAIGGELMPRDNAAAGSERQALDMVVLRRVGWRAVRGQRR